MHAASGRPVVLNLGAGLLTRPDAVNVDIWPGPGIDQIVDLNRYPWPWLDASVDEVFCLDILEHLEDFCAAMAELHRVMRPGARLHVRGPAWDREQSYSDPTHRRMMTLETFSFWQPGHWRHAKYPAYHRGCQFNILCAERSGEELLFDLERI